MHSYDEKLDYIDDIAHWYVSLAYERLRRDDLESSLRFAQVAASVLIKQNRTLASTELERLLQLAAQALPSSKRDVLNEVDSTAAKPRCLHVLDEALPSGGMTSMAVRWMANDSADRIHSVALVSQNSEIPQSITDAVRASGGRIHLPDDRQSFVRRARWLRELCHNTADLVILHSGISDPIAPTALGLRGGPPVMQVNHAAHTFWVGTTVSDVVVNCRGSALETYWTECLRGVRSVTIPIPLPMHHSSSTSLRASPDSRKQILARLGLPDCKRLLLTVGAAFKYQATPKLDFLSSMVRVLNHEPGTRLLAVGVGTAGNWNRASAQTGGRIHPLAPLHPSTLSELVAVADLYIEGFPFGSTTALLEAGARGIPVVLAPATSPPPYGTDGISVDSILRRPDNVDAYEAAILELLRDSEAASNLGQRLSRSIRHHHNVPGWSEHLATAISTLPRVHSVSIPKSLGRVPAPIYEHWSEFIDKANTPYAQFLEHSIVNALLLGLRPGYSRLLEECCRKAHSFRVNQAIPVWQLRILLAFILPLLPIRIALAVFRAVAFASRCTTRSLFMRLLHRLLAPRRASSWYADYAKVSRL